MYVYKHTHIYTYTYTYTYTYIYAYIQYLIYTAAMCKHLLQKLQYEIVKHCNINSQFTLLYNSDACDMYFVSFRN